MREPAPKIESWEVGNALLLLEQVWFEFEPAYEAMWRFFAACAFRSWSDDKPLTPSELIRCDECQKPIYRRAVDRWAIITLAEDEGFGCTPVTVVIGHQQRITACSVACLKSMIANMPESDFAFGGYPL